MFQANISSRYFLNFIDDAVNAKNLTSTEIESWIFENMLLIINPICPGGEEEHIVPLSPLSVFGPLYFKR